MNEWSYISRQDRVSDIVGGFFSFAYLFQQKFFWSYGNMHLKANSDKERVFDENKRKR